MRYTTSRRSRTSKYPSRCRPTPRTPFHPRSPYGVAKLYAFEIARVYRESYGMFVVNGILFNHESPRRGMNFVTRKIVHGVAEVAAGTREHISLGNLDAARPRGYAPGDIGAAG